MFVTGWIASFGLIVTGSVLLTQGIKQIQKFVGGPVLLKLPLTQKSGQFVVASTGNYAIWQSGRTLQRVPVKIAVPAISAVQTGEEVLVRPVFSSVRVNNGWEGRIQLFTFWAQAGQYKLELINSTASFSPELAYCLEIRERKPGYLLVLSILIILFAAACLITGLVVPFVSSQ